MDNVQKLQKAGDEIGDMLEISVIRREDYAEHKGWIVYLDLLLICAHA